MKKVLLFLLPMFMMAFVSCSSMRTLEKAPAGSMTPEVRLNISLDDIEYLGESTISVSTRSYFGCIKQIDMVNGEVFDRHNNTTSSSTATSPLPQAKSSKTIPKPTISSPFPTKTKSPTYSLANCRPKPWSSKPISTKTNKLKPLSKDSVGRHYPCFFIP